MPENLPNQQLFIQNLKFYYYLEIYIYGLWLQFHKKSIFIRCALPNAPCVLAFAIIDLQK